MIIIGKTSINKDAAKAMGETEFKNSMRGKISVDINELWIQIVGVQNEPVQEEKPKRSKRSLSDKISEQTEIS
jgi:hypothetical protein